MRFKDKRLAGVMLAIAVATAAWAGYGAHEKREQAREITALIAQTTAELRQGIGSGGATGGSTSVAAHYERLRAMRADRVRPLAEGAEHYLIGAREILRLREKSALLERQALASRQALAQHMRHAPYRNLAWLQEAAALKKNVEHDHSDLERTLKALDELLADLPDASRRLAPYVERGVLLEESARRAAMQRVIEEEKLAAAALERARRLPAS